MTPVAAGDVSVVIPAYNRAGLLAQTLASIERQTVAPAKVVVVDDGSTDSTKEMLADHDVTVVTNPDGGWGPGKARDAGLDRISTEFVTFVDSDDILMPWALELLRATLVAEPSAPFAYGCGLAVVQVEGEWRHQGVIATTSREQRDPLVSIFVRNSVPSSGALIRTDAIRRAGGYDPAVEWSEDHHLWIRLAQYAPPAHLPEIVCAYRRHSDNRYAPINGGVDARPILALAEGDPRLRRYVPDRVGVILCEALADAVGRGHPTEFAAAARALLPHQRPARIVARALSHARLRRASARLGDRVWRERPDIRDWLAHF